MVVREIVVKKEKQPMLFQGDLSKDFPHSSVPESNTLSIYLWEKITTCVLFRDNLTLHP